MAGYGPPAIAGVIGSELGARGGEIVGEALGIGGKRERETVGGTLGGAAAGAAVGTMIAPGPGTLVGAGVGAAVGFVTQIAKSVGCIIVTACNGADSAEVDITRRYRDEFMSLEAIRGYYIIAEKVVPVMNESKAIKESIKKELVDRLIEYGKFRLGESDRCSADAERISLKFLADCERMGKTVDSYTRMNGEEV
jgi:hypothetical protein